MCAQQWGGQQWGQQNANQQQGQQQQQGGGMWGAQQGGQQQWGQQQQQGQQGGMWGAQQNAGQQQQQGGGMWGAQQGQQQQQQGGQQQWGQQSQQQQQQGQQGGGMWGTQQGGQQQWGQQGQQQQQWGGNSQWGQQPNTMNQQQQQQPAQPQPQKPKIVRKCEGSIAPKTVDVTHMKLIDNAFLSRTHDSQKKQPIEQTQQEHQVQQPTNEKPKELADLQIRNNQRGSVIFPKYGGTYYGQQRNSMSPNVETPNRRFDFQRKTVAPRQSISNPMTTQINVTNPVNETNQPTDGNNTQGMINPMITSQTNLLEMTQGRSSFAPSMNMSMYNQTNVNQVQSMRPPSEMSRRQSQLYGTSIMRTRQSYYPSQMNQSGIHQTGIGENTMSNQNYSLTNRGMESEANIEYPSIIVSNVHMNDAIIVKKILSSYGRIKGIYPHNKGYIKQSPSYNELRVEFYDENAVHELAKQGMVMIAGKTCPVRMYSHSMLSGLFDIHNWINIARKLKDLLIDNWR